MKFSKTLIPTLREVPSDCDTDNISQVLMSRAGLIKRHSNGLYIYMPLMTRAMEKVEAEIRRGMASADCFETRFPILLQKQDLDDSGRWNAFGDNMFKMKDRLGKEMALSPTNEEAACFMAKNYIQSYNQLPFSLFQIQKKFRDEIRPKGGVMRTREFTMKDAYSFHATDECLGQYFSVMRDAYHKIFTNLGIKTVTVAADNGAMGGLFSSEVMALSNSGTDIVAICSKCNKAENVEVQECFYPAAAPKHTKNEIKKIHTPNIKTIDQLVKFLKTTPDKFAKSMIYQTEKGYVFVVLRGDHEVNDIKLRKYLGVTTLEPADKDAAEKAIGTAMGSAGPIGIKNARLVADKHIAYMKDFVVGANIHDYHLMNVNNGDFKAEYADIRIAAEGDVCACGNKLQLSKAYELGHIFALGQHYTKKLNLTYINAQNKPELLTMGCYGIGVERTIAAIIEQNNDANGIIWPAHVAPVTVNIITVTPDDPNQMKTSSDLYKQFTDLGIDTLWDDRTTVSPGVKFKDSDLIGVPYRIVVGRGLKDGKIEFAKRTGERKEVDLKNIKEILNEIQSIQSKRV